MKNLLIYTTLASIIALAGCSSSGDRGSATLAAAVPQAEETAETDDATPQADTTASTDDDNASDTGAADDTASSGDDSSNDDTAVNVSPAQEAVQSLPTTSEAETSNNLPTFNLDGSVGQTSFSRITTDPETGDRTITGTINGEAFTIDLDQNTASNGGVFVSEEGTIIVPDDMAREELFSNTPRAEGVNLHIIPFITGTDFDNDNAPTFNSAGFIIEGNLTEVSDLPSQATYSGRASSISIESIGRTTEDDPNPYTTSNFTATATFGQTNTLNGSLSDRTNGNDVATINAEITGNTFSGTITDNEGAGSTTLDGGFFGPNADAIAGAGTGNIDGEQIVIGIDGVRTDIPLN